MVDNIIYIGVKPPGGTIIVYSQKYFHFAEENSQGIIFVPPGGLDFSSPKGIYTLDMFALGRYDFSTQRPPED